MAEAEGGSEQDDVSFLRTVSVSPERKVIVYVQMFNNHLVINLIITKQEDMVCLSCTATGERVMLAAEGFGNRHCFLENIADKNIPPDLSQCVFVIEQALSVRALQELVTAAGSESVCTTLFHFVHFINRSNRRLPFFSDNIVSHLCIRADSVFLSHIQEIFSKNLANTQLLYHVSIHSKIVLMIMN